MSGVKEIPRRSLDKQQETSTTTDANDYALFEPGLHVVTREQLRVVCVDPFPTSATRLDLTTKCFQFLDWFESFRVRGDIWVDGSFTTSKIDPRDIDLVAFVDSTDIDQLENSRYNEFCQLKDRPLIRARYNCDVYVDPLGDEARVAYWRGKLGRDERIGLSKGIAVLKIHGSAR